MEINNSKPISEWYLQKAYEWADLEYEAAKLEEQKSARLSELILAKGEMPLNRADALVRASTEWQQYIQQMVQARRDANIAKVELRYLEFRHREFIGEDANNRMAARV